MLQIKQQADVRVDKDFRGGGVCTYGVLVCLCACVCVHACMCAVVPDVLGNHEDLDSLELLAFPLLLDFLVHQSNQPAQLYPIGGEEQME